uniref:helix-hairpin-helix domain-containing protein n=1 Tax=uncultured Clostridium sp. TaxID=59620 RepID=UPI002627FBF0
HKEESAKNVYDLIVKFADFGFNKSHSVAYAFIAYQMAYLKVHFKEFYYINLLNTNIGGETKTKEYIDEAKHAGITVLKPDINLSNIKYAKEVDGIRLPLRVIKGVGIVAGNKIIELRGDKPFTDFYDFIARCYGFNVNKKVLESLIMAGVFDAYGYNRATLIKNINSAITYGELIREIDSSLVNKPLMEKYSEYSEIELMNAELELYGYYVSTHPASKYPKCFKLINIEKYFDKFVETVVLIESIKTIKTKTNKDMAFIKASDETFSGEFTCFESVMSSVNFFKKGDLVKVKGRVEKRLDKFSVIVQSIEKI